MNADWNLKKVVRVGYSDNSNLKLDFSYSAC